MGKKLFRILSYVGIIFLTLAVTFLSLMYFKIIWHSPPHYPLSALIEPEVPIMSMTAYDTLGQHTRPYLYRVHNTKGKGSVFVAGIGHTKDPNDIQLDRLTSEWNSYSPDVALVESRLGFLFSWLQDPVSVYGENGKTMSLSIEKGIPVYSWEPDKDTEIAFLTTKYSPEKVALFYSLRPYFSNFRYGKPENPNKKMNEYILSRTDYDGIRGLISDYTEIDRIWQKDFPNEKDWRDTSDQYGWPRGYLSEIAALSNQVRDLHLCSIIYELTSQGKHVFATMGASHAFRIEASLKHQLES